MGRYFGIKNVTKNERVSSYWKEDPWCNCNEVMHKFHWISTDKIFSATYDDCYNFVYDPIKLMMCIKLMCIDSYISKSESLSKDSELITKYTSPLEKSYGFNYDESLLEKTGKHMPIWKDNKCVLCGYNYEEDYKTSFDKTFYMN